VDCIHTAEDIVIFLVQPGRPITLVFDPMHRYPIPRGTHSWDGWEKLAIFYRNCRLSRKRCEI